MADHEMAVIGAGAPRRFARKSRLSDYELSHAEVPFRTARIRKAEIV
jgi:hypothetical protein